MGGHVKAPELSAEVRGDCFLGLFDILGFQHLIEARPLSEVINLLDGEEFRTAAGVLPTMLGEMRKMTGFQPHPCRVIRFSDTILLYSSDRSERSFVGLLEGSTALLAACLALGVPLRGAVTAGEFYVSQDRATYLGRALVQAYKMERVQEWSGAVLDTAAIPADPQFTATEDCLDLWTTAYAAPLKEGSMKVLPCLNWPRLVRGMGLTLEALLDKQPNPPNDWSAWRKRENTRQFYHHAVADVDSRRAFSDWPESWRYTPLSAHQRRKRKASARRRVTSEERPGSGT